MDDRELLERVKAVMVEMHQLIEAADRNSKYHTKQQLTRAWHIVIGVHDELDWHVNGARSGDRRATT